MKNALNRTGTEAMMNVPLANIAERQQIFITLSYKQMTPPRNIESFRH
jgi:hypothetical protein